MRCRYGIYRKLFHRPIRFSGAFPSPGIVRTTLTYLRTTTPMNFKVSSSLVCGMQFTEHCDTATWSTPGHDTVTIPLHCTAPEVTGSYAVTDQLTHAVVRAGANCSLVAHWLPAHFLFVADSTAYSDTSSCTNGPRTSPSSLTQIFGTQVTIEGRSKRAVPQSTYSTSPDFSLG